MRLEDESEEESETAYKGYLVRREMTDDSMESEDASALAELLVHFTLG